MSYESAPVLSCHDSSASLAVASAGPGTALCEALLKIKNKTASVTDRGWPSLTLRRVKLTVTTPSSSWLLCAL